MRFMTTLRAGLVAAATLTLVALSGCSTVCGDDLINCQGRCDRARVDCKQEGNKAYCKKQYFDACRSLGVLYNHGLNVERDNKKAVAYYLLACQQDDPLACTHLAFMYENGHGTEVSLSKALRYYRLGCESHVNTACLGKERLEDANEAPAAPAPPVEAAPAPAPAATPAPTPTATPTTAPAATPATVDPAKIEKIE